MLGKRPLLQRFLSEAAGGGFSRLKLTYQGKKNNADSPLSQCMDISSVYLSSSLSASPGNYSHLKTADR